ncbi:MAG: hypothetical protein U0269_33590 [Polyangiales bacterium]
MKRASIIALCVALVACSGRTAMAPRIAASSVGASSNVRSDVVAQDAAEPEPASGPRCEPLLAVLRERPGSIATVSADASPPVVAACARLEREAQRTLSAVQRRARDVSLAELGPIGRCANAGRGAWFIAPVRTRASFVPRYTDRSERAWEVHVDWRVDYVDAAGRRHEGTVGGEAFHTDPSDEQLSIVLQYDGDGDGIAEIIVGTRSTNFEGGDSFSAVQVAWVNGAAVSDPRFDGIDVSQPVDPDGDGRVDFAQPSTFEYFWMSSNGPQTDRGPSTLVHRLPDGALSRDDAVTRAFVLAQCFDDGEALSLDTGEDQLLLRAVCDRIFGANIAAMQQRLEALEAEGAQAPAGELRERVLRAPLPFAVDRCAP